MSRPIVNISASEREAFASWSNGNANSTFREAVSGPLSLHAIFDTQYRIGLAGTDAYGNQIPVSYFIVDGKLENGTFFLNANQTHSVEGAYYKGVLLPVNVSISAAAPSNVSVALPIYNISIRTVDLFLIPVNATVSLTYGNLSSSRTFSGASGTVQLADAPYGAANGTASYFGMSSPVTVGYGKAVTVFFISPTNIAAFAIAAVVIVYVAFRRMPKKKTGTPTPSLSYGQQ